MRFCAALILVGLLGCTGTSSSGDADVGPLDVRVLDVGAFDAGPGDALRADVVLPPSDAELDHSASSTDGRPPGPDAWTADATPKLDLGLDTGVELPDAGGLDAVRDVALDAALAPRDTAPDDAFEPDETPGDVPLQDAGEDVDGDLGAPSPDACVGIEPPPVPGPSLDGSEVCNYVDDDGDGVVDEGFEYGWISDELQINPEGHWFEGKHRLAKLPNGGFVAVWQSRAGVHVHRLAPNLCNVTRPLVFSLYDAPQAYLNAIDVAVGPNRVGVVLAYGPGRDGAIPAPIDFHDNFVLFLDESGIAEQHRALGERETYSNSAWARYPGGFALFTQDADSAWIIRYNEDGFQEGEARQLPELANAATLAGMTFDGDGLAFVWNEFVDGARSVNFVRYSLEAELMLGPVNLGGGGFPRNIGVSWTGTAYLTPVELARGVFELWLSYLQVEDGEVDQFVRRLAFNLQGPPIIRWSGKLGAQHLILALAESPNHQDWWDLYRTSSRNHTLATRIPGERLWAAVETDSGLLWMKSIELDRRPNGFGLAEIRWGMVVRWFGCAVVD